LLDAIVADVKRVAVLRGEYRWFGIVLFIENTSEEVVFELCDKVL